MHLASAEQRHADALLTFNPDDFRRLATAASPRIAVPPDPPAIRLS